MKKGILEKVDAVRGMVADRCIRHNFANHNKEWFAQKGTIGKDNGIILVEFNGICSSHIAYSYLANALRYSRKADMHCYLPIVYTRWQRLKARVKSRFSDKTLSIYKSFGCRAFIIPSLAGSQPKRAKEYYLQAINEINSKYDLERLQVGGVWIGDLVYDSYLREKCVPTVDIKSKDFQRFLHRAIRSLVYWLEYFEKHRVVGIIGSHCVYSLAIPLRVAMLKEVPAYQANLSSIYCMTSDRQFAYTDFLEYPALFQELEESQQVQGLKRAKERIDRRLAGEVGVDMRYSKKSAYGAFQEGRLVEKSDRLKVLIAAHCFFDSPHSYGLNLFPDFSEWLDCLGKLSTELDYDWYIKTHPDFIEGTMRLIEDFVERFPKIKLLPANSSHHQLISEGIAVALTTYGTIGFEYAAMGKTVVNASVNNPHVAYDFTISPRTEYEYVNTIKNLDSNLLQPVLDSVYEYYFMKNIYYSDNIFVNDFSHFINAVGGSRGEATSAAYAYWMNYFSSDQHIKVFSSIVEFDCSGQFRMTTLK